MPNAPFHSRAIIVSTGDEIITGQLLDTNSRYLADQLISLGILPIQHLTLPDELPALVAELRRACAAADLIIMSGGLGPTDGDLTRQALAELTGHPLVLDTESEAAIAQMLAKRARPMTDRQRRQALRPDSAAALRNPFGTAPGLHAVVGSADIFCLPGPPAELKPMWEQQVIPRLRPDPSKLILTRLLHIVGIPEADCVERLGDLTKRDHSDSDAALVGITASGGILTLRIRAQGPRAAQLAAAAEAHARRALADHIITPTSDSNPPTSGLEAFPRHLLDALRALNPPAQLAVVESCTGGMLGELITAIPGSSSNFRGGFITYSNDLKERLGVDAHTLRQHGAVSPQVAREMATTGLLAADADVCLAITGIAGPEGGTPSKPVGTVHIALAERSHSPGTSAAGAAAAPAVHSRHFLFTGDRAAIRQRACVSALTMLHFRLKSHPPGQPRLLWELPPQPSD